MSEKNGANDVVLQISTDQEAFFPSQQQKDAKAQFFPNNPQLGSSSTDSNLELAPFDKLKVRLSPSSSEAAKPSWSSPAPSPSTAKPPRMPTQSITRRKSLSRSEFSKPKSRFVEPSYPNDAHLEEEEYKLVDASSPQRNKSSNVPSPNNNVSSSSPKENLKSAPVTPKTPLIAAQEEEEEEVYQTAILKVSSLRGKKWKASLVIELALFVSLLAILIASFTVDRLKDASIWGLELWKWSVLVLVILCGRLVTEWFMNVLVFLIERNFLLKKKVLYFVYGLKTSVRAFIWVGLILLVWGLLFTGGVKRTRHTTKVLNKVTRSLAAFLIGTAIWLVKTFLVKLLASSFHVTRFFDRIQESIFHQYVLVALSRPPSMEMGVSSRRISATYGQLSFRTPEKQNEEKKEELIDVDKLKKIRNEKVSAWTMKGLMNVVTGTGLTTLSNSFNQNEEDDEKKDTEITSEWEAKAAAYKIFKNVAKPGSKYIEEEDLLRFMKREEVDSVIPLFEGAAETRKIKRSTLKNWLVNVYNERKALAHSLNDSKTAIKELNKLVSAIVLVVIIIMWLFMMGYLTTNILVFVSSQLLLVGFMFGNTAKTVFEAIIFVFVMHPFDVGDRCVIDGVQMVVEEMNILTTVFLRYDNEKIFYPNPVLATKPISNFYRSPEMSDSVEFCVDVSTSIETIGRMKAQIKTYLESKPQHWRGSFGLQVKDIENVNKMKMGLYVNHTINFQNSGERGNRRSDLVLELKNIFEDLGVKYHLLPQEVYLHNVLPPAR